MPIEDYELCAMPWFPLYCGDLLKDTMHLNATEFGVYSLFLIIIYSTGRPLPANDDQLRMMARLPTGVEWTHIRHTVLEHYFYETTQGWFKNKCGEVMTEQTRQARAASLRGKKGAEARWGRHDDNDPYGIAQTNAQAMPEQSNPQSHPNSNSETKTHNEACNYKPLQEGDKKPKDIPKWEWELMADLHAFLGGEVMTKDGGLWRQMVREDRHAIRSALLEMQSLEKEGKRWDTTRDRVLYDLFQRLKKKKT